MSEKCPLSCFAVLSPFSRRGTRRAGAAFYVGEPDEREPLTPNSGGTGIESLPELGDLGGGWGILAVTVKR